MHKLVLLGCLAQQFLILQRLELEETKIFDVP